MLDLGGVVVPDCARRRPTLKPVGNWLEPANAAKGGALWYGIGLGQLG